VSTNPYQPPLSAGVPSAGKLPRDLGPITRWVTIVFGLQAVLMLAMAAAFAVDPSILSQLESADLPSLREAFFGLSAIAWIALLIPGIVLFCVWIRRANMNADALVPSGMEFTPGWAVGWFFVPFANLFKPYQVVGEIYRASNPDADPDFWSLSELPSFLKIWWGSYLAFNVVRNVNSRIQDTPGNQVFAFAEFALGCLAAMMVVVVVRSIHRLQLRKAALH
jgi:hypothetical protein